VLRLFNDLSMKTRK